MKKYCLIQTRVWMMKHKLVLKVIPRIKYDEKTYFILKRIFDVVVSSFLLALSSILILPVCIVIIVETHDSPIYSQLRVGKNGRVFKMYKLRTMVKDSDNIEKYFTPSQVKEWLLERKVENDPRITRLGLHLRRFSIDEFPQLVNVLLGQMSLIGPRAITRKELEWFGEDKAKLLTVYPGITGLWQSGPRNSATFESGERQKIELDYVQNASIKLDLLILVRTIKAILGGTGK